mmetsp:Transcript_17599/g.12552  ORF Transcript_17599/g.12552 Transcript_17599/m.12552 type:complete len:109 (+) Transcript_17599:108-434(+)
MSPGGDTATSKLANSRQSRKKAEEDVKLLANRIALLKAEEKKAWKKIEETKKKAKEIMKVKERVDEQTKMKQDKEMQKQEELKQIQQKNELQKDQIKQNIQITKEQHQ